MYFLKILLSLSGAVMLATLPGFFDINYGVGGLTIRAAGGAAAFVFIYTQSPHIPALKSTVAPVSPIEKHRTSRTSGADSFGNGSLPLMLALSFDPISFASSTRSITTVEAGARTGGEGGYGHQSGSGPVSVIMQTVTHTVVQVANSTLALLDRSSTLLRTAVSWIGQKVAHALETLLPLETFAVSELRDTLAELPDTTGAILDSALAPALSAIDGLSTQLGETSPLLNVVGDTVAVVPQVLNGTTAAVTDTVGNLTETVGDTLSSTVGTVNNLATGLLRDPRQAVALTGEAVGDLSKGLVDTTTGVLSATKGLTDGAGAQIAAITDKLNDVAPALVSQINPDFDRAARDADKLRENAGLLARGLGDVTAALPALPEVKSKGLLGLDTGRLGNGRLGGADRLGGGGERFNESAEIRGGCTNCLLQPIENTVSGASAVLNSGASRLGSGLSRAGAGSGSGSGRIGGGPASAGGSAAASAGPAGGPVSGVVNSVGSTLNRTTRGLLGGRR
jgi:hypothetical protein